MSCFNLPEREIVVRLLEEQCGGKLPGLERLNAVELERVRFAALKMSGGDMAELHAAIGLAKSDWRDLLMAAGFGEDIGAHSK